jgi:hypothetical protein
MADGDIDFDFILKKKPKIRKTPKTSIEWHKLQIGEESELDATGLKKQFIEKGYKGLSLELALLTANLITYISEDYKKQDVVIPSSMVNKLLYQMPSTEWIKDTFKYYKKLTPLDVSIIKAWTAYADISINRYIKKGISDRFKLKEETNMYIDPMPECQLQKICIKVPVTQETGEDFQIITMSHIDYFKRLQQLILNAPTLDKDIVVYRGAKSNQYIQEKDHIVESKTFMATSYNYESALKFADKEGAGYMSRIYLPKGYKCLLIPAKYSRFKNE